MGSAALGVDSLSGAGTPTALDPAQDRFAHWPRSRAIALLVALLALLVASALVPLTVGRGEVATPAQIAPLPGIGHASVVKTRPRDDDLKLYDAVIDHIDHGRSYYAVVVAEHRKAHYPVRPGVAVRLPTLAYLDAAMGVHGDAPAPVAMAAAVALMVAVGWAWWGRLGDELGKSAQAQSLRRIAVALLMVGASLGLNRYYFVLHELWAGMLIALAFGLHRPARPGKPGRWLAAWGAAALALAIREHTLPFVLLLAAWALYHRAWKEAAAWSLLIGLFAAGLAIHLHLIALQTLPSDPAGPSWLALRGLGGWLSNVVLSSNLRFFPHWLAGPLVVLMMLGWAGWKSPAGAFATLLYLGYGLLFMVAGRDDNFYWGAVIAPAMFVGLAFVPMGLGSLVRKAAQG
jgi:hypothetical protein